MFFLLRDILTTIKETNLEFNIFVIKKRNENNLDIEIDSLKEHIERKFNAIMKHLEELS